MPFTHLAQPGTLTDPTSCVEYLTFVVKEGADTEALQEALATALGMEKAIGAKDSSADLSVTFGVSHHGWTQFFPSTEMPKELVPFSGLKDGNRSMPATQGDIFFMVKSHRMDLNFQTAKYIRRAFLGLAELVDDVQGYKYLDSRDMIDFVDGTENPKAQARAETVLVQEDTELHQGGSYLFVQKYIHIDNLLPWDSKPVEYQEKVIGRTKMDDIELPDDQRPAWAHNNKGKVVINDEEQRMFRQNRSFGNAQEHGTMFVGFCATAKTLLAAITQMITADENGDYDRLLDFVKPVTGTLYFCPSQRLIEQFQAD